MMLYALMLWLVGVEVREVPHPAQGSSMAAELSTGYDGKLYMTWIERESQHKGTLMFASYADGAWSEAFEIQNSDRMFINWADAPKMIALKDLMIAVWPQMNGSGIYSYGMMYATSTDSGKTWSSRRWLHNDRSPMEHGFISLAETKEGQAMAIWLDGGNMSYGEDGHGHGTMEMRFRTVSASGLGPESIVDKMTCECCNTDMVTTGKDLLLAYRDRNHDEIRDISLTRFDGTKWSKGKTVREDNWKIAGCPVNGPSLAVDNKHVALAWYTQAPKQLVRMAFSSDGGRTFASEAMIEGNLLGRVDSELLPNNRLAVSWVEAADEQQFVKLAFYDTANNLKPIGEPIKIDDTPDGRASGFPRMMQHDGALIFVYQDPKGTGVKVVQVKAP